MKNIKYDGGVYLSNLRKINGGNDDKNKVVDHLNITDRIIVNKFKYIDRLLAKFSKDKNSGRSYAAPHSCQSFFGFSFRRYHCSATQL